MKHSLTTTLKIGAYASVFLVSSFLTVSAQMIAADGSNESTTTRSNYIEGWRRQSSDLTQKISMLDTASTTSVIMPVLFGVEPSDLSPNFGDPRSNGRTHAGEDIMAQKNTPIVSPTKAVVLRTGVGSGEGNYVYTANPGGETFVYMHLDHFGEGVVAGTVLEKGSLIGYVGNTGNASGGLDHLHFEIHDANGVPTDPFPRLTGSFTLQEKIQYLTQILTQTSDANALSLVLVTNFRQTFNVAVSQGISLPAIISNFMTSLPNTLPPTGVSLPLNDLELGSKGDGVVRLQQYLLAKNTGPLAVRLAQAGATGNFGAITQAALIEYQIHIGINPADGYYGASTRSIVEANPIIVTPSVPVVTSSPSAPPTTPVASSTSSFIFTRNLNVGVTGEDVRTLQKFLNSHGYVIAATGPGSPGNETLYFGQATQASVIRLQSANSISPAAGYVGSLTRAFLVSMGI